MVREHTRAMEARGGHVAENQQVVAEAMAALRVA
jgi:hypothetical protein